MVSGAKQLNRATFRLVVSKNANVGKTFPSSFFTLTKTQEFYKMFIHTHNEYYYAKLKFRDLIQYD